MYVSRDETKKISDDPRFTEFFPEKNWQEKLYEKEFNKIKDYDVIAFPFTREDSFGYEIGSPKNGYGGGEGEAPLLYLEGPWISVTVIPKKVSPEIKTKMQRIGKTLPSDIRRSKPAVMDRNGEITWQPLRTAVLREEIPILGSEALYTDAEKKCQKYLVPYEGLKKVLEKTIQEVTPIQH